MIQPLIDLLSEAAVEIVLPPDLKWYDELGGKATGWVCEVNGPGWWHLEELNLEAGQ